MTQEDLINIAKNACKNAYVPSTGYMVGAALLAKSGTVYIGVNVEDEKIPNYLFAQKETQFRQLYHMEIKNLLRLQLLVKKVRLKNLIRH